MSGENEYIRSFAGMFPANDPEIIIYAVVKRPSYGSSAILSTSVKKLIQDIGKYMNINQVTVEDPAISDVAFTIPNLLNKSVDNVKALTHSSIIIGDGTKVIDQYPKAGTIINDDDKLFVITNSKNIVLENMKNWSSRDVSNYCDLIGIKCNIDGYGYADSQSIPAGTNISGITEVNITFKKNEKV
jgi:penicillin-binding protein 2B